MSKKRATRIFLWVGLLFVLLFSSLFIYRVWVDTNSYFEELVDAQLQMGLEFDLAIREYVASNVRPFAEAHVDAGMFVPEVMSTSYAAREIFNRVRTRFPDYVIKFSSDNPRNPENQAGPEELEVIDYFNANPEVKRRTNQIVIDGKPYMAAFRARRAQESCLRCHGDPARAPASLVSRYGDTAGFHRPIGEVIALDMVAIPVNTNQAAMKKKIIQESMIILVGLLLAGGAVYFVFSWLLSKMTEQSQFLRTVVDSISHPFYVIDAETYDIELANKAAAEQGQKDGTKCYEVSHSRSGPCSGDEHPCTLKEVKETGSDVILEHVHYDAEGKPRFVEVHGSPIYNQEGRIEKVIEYAIDITERKKAEQAMQENEQRLSTILHSLCSGIILIDAETHQVLDVNAAASEMIGLNKEEIVGRVCHTFFCPAEKGNCPITDHHQCLNRSERVMVRADGTEMPILKNATLVDINGRQCILENFFDLTAQKETEKVLKESRQIAENAAKMKSRFLANMSHEIRTPMNSIIGFCDLLFDEDLTDEQRDYLKMIHTNGRQLLQLINDILDFSKVEAGKLSIAPRACLLSEILSEVEMLVLPLVKDKDLAFEIQSDGHLPETLFVDDARLKQCLINLVNNAIKFTEEGGVHVRVKTQRQQDQLFIRFDVEDTGIGINPEVQQRIFDSFTQADDSTTRKYVGTGLGLAITRQLAELMGGALTLVSEEGVGSVFSLIMPAEMEAVAAEN